MNKAVIIPIVAVILLLIDFYLFQAVKTLTQSWTPQNRKITHAIYWLVSFLLISGIFVINFVKPELVGEGLRKAIMVGLFVVYASKIFGVVIVFVDDLVRLIRLIVEQFREEPSSAGEKITRSTFLAKLTLFFTTFPFLAMIYGIVVGAHNYRVIRKKVYMPNLPDGFEGLKIAQISDIHSGSFHNKTAVERGVKMLLDQKPDLVFFTGDLVNNRAVELDNYKDVFNKITAPMGVYSILGNHDYGDYYRWETPEQKVENLARLKETHKEIGWNLLLNENVTLEREGSQIALLGVENWGAGGFAKHGDIEKAYKGTEDKPVKILLSHDPSHWRAKIRPEYKDIDLTLSGHTHGMQFGVEIGSIKWSPVKYRYEQWAGLYKEDNQYLYVNRGFGYLGYPGRIGMPPEITILELTNVMS
ncbi:MAG: putative MPP superfamily phosphohydrolase [Arenicella sp.]|jgi:predicted MPP superfamily phosphohydrolase